MLSYSAEDDATQLEYATALDSCFGKVDIAPPAKTPAQISPLAGSAAAAAIAAGPSTSSGKAFAAPEPPFDVPSGGASAPVSLHRGHDADSSVTANADGTFSIDSDTAVPGAPAVDLRCNVPSWAAQDLASDSTGAQNAAGTHAGGPGGEALAGTSTGSQSATSTGAAVGRAGGVQFCLLYTSPSPRD